MSDNTDKRTATQRIEDLEKVLTVVCNALNQMQSAVNNLFQSQQEVGLIKEALKILDRKTDGIVKSATAETGISPNSVRAYVLERNMEDLTKQVADYVTNGKLAPTDSVGSDGYCVCEEYNADGTLFNPRIQFRVDAQNKETADALLGKKAGDMVSLGEGKFTLKVLETYAVLPEKAPEAQTPTETTTTAEATTETTSSAAPAGPSNSNFEAPPSETPVEQFVSDAGSVDSATA